MRVLGLDRPPEPAAANTGEQRQGFEIADYQKTAVALTVAAAEIRLMLGDIRALIDSPESKQSADDEPEFDVREYAAAANSIQSGTAEIRGLISDLRGLSNDEALQGGIAVLRDEGEAAAQRTVAQATGVVDHLFVRLLQSAFVIFLLACGYAWLGQRLRQK